LGGEKLRNTIFILLFLGAGLLTQIPLIYAQEIQSQGEDPLPEAVNPLRLAEQAFVLEDNDPGITTTTGPSVWAAIRMILILALAAAAIYGIVFLIKRTSKQTVTSDPFLKILATSHLGNNRYAHVVAVGSKAWLLGSSDGGVNLIGEIADKDIIDAMLLEESKKSAETPGRLPDFMSILRRMGARPQSNIPGADDIRKRRERLKGL
jgi:flagellar protein FliO/FliZ